MADTKISALPDGSPAQALDQIPINRVGTNYRINAAAIGAVSFPGVPSGLCLPNQTAVNSGVGDFYSCSNGSWVKIGPTAGSLVSPITSPSPLNFDIDLHFKGPNPWIDITRYGARSTAAGAPASPGITAGITSGLAIATLSAASTFQNGDGVNIFGAGAVHGMATPAAPAVTPSLPFAGTGTGLVVSGPAGATTYNYQIIARNKSGGLTAASSVGTTATGAATLGAQNVNISTLTRSGTTVTVVTSSPHGLSVGCVVSQAGTSDIPNFDGYFTVITVPDNTHYTYTSGLDTASGASTAATGGTANWFNCNHLTWASVANAFCYYIYGRTGGSLTLIGVSLPDNSNVSTLYWDDFGSPMMDNFQGPYFVPTTPPVAATSNNLVTTIASGAGTTTLTLAANAGTTVVGATILFDNAPAIASAAAAARSGSGMLLISVGGFIINSYLNLSGSPLAVSQAGGLTLNDTIETNGNVRWYGNLTPVGASVPSFGNEGQNSVNVQRAYPGFYGNGLTAMHGLTFNSGVSNNVNLLLIDSPGAGNLLKDLNFITGTSGADYMGSAIIMRGSDVNSVFTNLLQRIVITGGPNQVNNTSATPFIFCSICGLTKLDYIQLSIRGLMYVPASGGGNFIVDYGRYQGGIMPFLTVSRQSGGSVGGIYVIKNIQPDTMTSALFAHLPAIGASIPSVYLEADGSPSSGVPLITGQPVRNLNVLFPEGNLGQNTGVMSGSQFFNSAVTVNGALGGIGFAMSTPLPPTSAVVSAGGSVPIGTVSYYITAVDAAGAETLFSLATNAVTFGGNQTVTVTPPAAPVGSVKYNVYRSSGGAIQSCHNGQGILWTNTYVDTFGFTDTTPTEQGRALRAGVNSSFMESAQLVLANSNGTSNFLGPALFAALGTPANGTFQYCSDCTIANPCASGGNGAFAKRLNGVWVCN